MDVKQTQTRPEFRDWKLCPMCVLILPPPQVCKSLILWGRHHKEDDDMMNIRHVFVQTRDVENEANYRMNGKQFVATPTRQDISMSLSFRHAWFLLVFREELRDVCRNLTRFLCDAFHEDYFSCSTVPKVFLQIIYWIVEIWKCVSVSNS